MSIKKFQCPSCGASLDYEDTRALTMRCPYCNSSVIVPESLRVAASTRMDMNMGSLDSVLDEAPTARLAEVAHLIYTGKKIEAIKTFRDIFQVGLKEAKDAVDGMEAGHAVDITAFGISGSPAMSNMTVVTTPGTTLDAETSAEIQRLMQSGNKIAAIKLMREKTGLGLAEAKNAVEAMELAFKVSGFFGRTPTITNMATTTSAADGLVTVVDADSALKPTVVGGERRGCGGWFLALLLIAGLLIFAPMPWGIINDTLDLPANAVPANGQSLWQKYSTEFPSDLGVALPGATSSPLLTFGSSGTGPGAFSQPRHITLDGQGYLYIADLDTGRIQRFNDAGDFQSLFRLNAEPTLGIVATRDGDLYVNQSGQIGLYDGETGDKLETISLGGLFSIATHVNLAPDGSLLAAVIAPDEQVVRLNRRGGNTNRLNINAPFSNLTGQREGSMFVAEDGVGNIYVVGGTNNTILKFNQDGIFLNQFGAAEIDNLSANGIAIDSKGRIYVPHFDGISVFDGDGRHLTLMEVNDGVAHGIAIGENDTVWVVTSTSKVLQLRAIP